MNKKLIVWHCNSVHSPCMDGLMSAYAAYKAYPLADFYPGIYGVEPDYKLFRQYDLIICVDFSYPLEVVNRVIKYSWFDVLLGRKKPDFLIIDHHKTAMDLSGFVSAVFDMNRSGAALTWETLNPDEAVPTIIQYVEDRDLWRFNCRNSHNINAGLFFALPGGTDSEYLKKVTFPKIDYLTHLSEDALDRLFAPIGEHVRAIDVQRMNVIAETVEFAMIDDALVAVVRLDANTWKYRSDLAPIIRQMYGETVDYQYMLAYVYRAKENRYDLAFRSNGYNVEAVAKQFGGGGHVRASGAESKNLDFIRYVSYED